MWVDDVKHTSFWRLRVLFIGALLVLGAVVVYVVSPSGALRHLFLRTTVARHGTVEHVVTGQGFMVRSEETVIAPHDGTVTLLATELQRVRPGQALVQIKQDPRRIVAAALDELDRAIALVDREAAAEAGDLQRQIDALDPRIAALEKEMMAALSAGNRTMTHQLEQQLGQLHGERGHLQSRLEQWKRETEMRRAGLVAEKDDMLASVRVEETVIVAQTPGTVTFAVDDYVNTVTVGQVSDALWDAVGGTFHTRLITDGDDVTAGAPVLRLLDGLGSHVFVLFSEAPAVVQGQQVWLRWMGNTDTGVRARVHTAHTRIGEVGIWFSLEQDSNEFAGLRSLSDVEVIVRRVSGVVLPNSAVTYRNDRPGVYLMAEGSPVFRYVQVRGSDADYVVVDDVPVGALVVTNPRRLDR